MTYSTDSNRRVALRRRAPLMVVIFATFMCDARAGVLVDSNSANDIPNNDDYSGDFGTVNLRGFANFLGFEHDQRFIVRPSGGTTEYAISLSGEFASAPAESIQLELGFGIGERFVSAASVFPELDFDAPVPGLPAPSSNETFATVNHQPHRIEYSNGLADDFFIGVAKFSIDVPDLPLSVNDHYAPGELPGNLPPGAAVFTLRKLSSGTPIVPMMAPEFENDYSIIDLGEAPGVETSTGGYGGLTFKSGDPQMLLIGGNADAPQGALFAVKMVRDAENHITGFAGSATRYADAPHIDGGLQYGPGGVLFLTRWPPKPIVELGQSRPGSTTTDKVVFLDSLGVTDGPGGLSFVPPGLPGAGQLKIVGAGGQWYTLDIAPDGVGTFNVTAHYCPAISRTVLTV